MEPMPLLHGELALLWANLADAGDSFTLITSGTKRAQREWIALGSLLLPWPLVRLASTDSVLVSESSEYVDPSTFSGELHFSGGGDEFVCHLALNLSLILLHLRHGNGDVGGGDCRRRARA